MRKCVVAVLVGLLVLSGCREAAVQPAAVTESERPVVTELELFSSKRENVAALEQLIGQFNEQNPDIRIVLNAPADAEITLKTRINKGDVPDIIAYGGDKIYTDLTAAGLLMDLSEEACVRTLQQPYREMVYDINGDRTEKMYGIPFATNASGIIYNKAIFEQHHIAVPGTWAELIRACEQLQAAGVTPFELAFKEKWAILPSWNSLVPELMPEDFIERKSSGETTFADTHREVLEKYIELISYAQEDYMNTSYEQGNRRFAEGSAAMLINGCWALPEIKKANPDIELDMFTFPGTDDPLKNKVTSGIDVLLAVSADCPEPEAAKRFIAFMMQLQVQYWYMEDQFAFSAAAGVNQDNPMVTGVIEDIKAGRVADFADHYYPVGLDIGTILSEFLLNHENGAEPEQNISDTLKVIDQQYDLFAVN